MEISEYSLFGTQELDEAERIRRTQGSKKEKSVLENLGNATDRVSISDEARTLYEEMRTKQAQEKEDQAKQEQAEAEKKSAFNKTGSNSGASAEADAETAASGVQGGSGSGGGSSSSSSSVDKIKQQIEQLQAKVQTLATGSLPDATKTSTIAAYEAQISALQQQLQEAETAEAG